jgi:hypothetical protein
LHAHGQRIGIRGWREQDPGGNCRKLCVPERTHRGERACGRELQLRVARAERV